MRQLHVDRNGNRLFLDGDRFVLRFPDGRSITIATKRGNRICIVKKPTGHFLFYRQGFGINKALADWGAAQRMTLDFEGFDGDGKPVHFEEPLADVVKARVFQFKGCEEQYQLVVPFAKKAPATPQGSLFA